MSGLVDIVVPTYNERQNLARLVEAIQEHVRGPYEIVIVDDGSPDGTADLARDLAKTHPIRLVERARKSGLGSAYRDGFRAAYGDVIFEMDADHSHDPRHVPALLQAIADGADIALGSRYVPGGEVAGWSAYRRLVSGVGNGLARATLGLTARDTTTGFRCFARNAASVVLESRSDGYAFQVEALHRATKRGLRIVEVPIKFENRTVGKSKLGVGEFAKFVRTLARLKFERAGHARPRKDRVAPAAGRDRTRPRGRVRTALSVALRFALFAHQFREEPLLSPELPPATDVTARVDVAAHFERAAAAVDDLAREARTILPT